MGGKAKVTSDLLSWGRNPQAVMTAGAVGWADEEEDCESRYRRGW